MLADEKNSVNEDFVAVEIETDLIEKKNWVQISIFFQFYLEPSIEINHDFHKKYQ